MIEGRYFSKRMRENNKGERYPLPLWGNKSDYQGRN